MRDLATIAEPTPVTNRKDEPSVPSGRPLRVVVVDEELPFPANSGKRIRTLNLITRLARRHQVTLVCHRNTDPREAKDAADYLADHSIASVVADRTPPPRSGLAFAGRLVANLLSPLPYSVASHASRELRQAMDYVAASGPVDLWQCEGTTCAATLRSVPGPRIVHTQNVEAMIWRRYLENERNPVRRWYIKRQWQKFRRFECQMLGGAEHVVAVSQTDANVFRNDYGVRRVDVVENGVDTAYFRPAEDTVRHPKRLLFLGSLDWRPNRDAVDQLLDVVFPSVRTSEPQAELAIVGRSPSAALRAKIAAQTGVELHADVADVRPYLASAGLLVVPLRVGGGSRIKILEALASGLPVISTRVGAEGLDLDPDNHLTVVDTITELIPAIVQAIRQPSAKADQARRGRQAVIARHDWDYIAARLERVWINCLRAGRVAA
jgi:glycosyltransferase involved in cell wall biosynthesis